MCSFYDSGVNGYRCYSAWCNVFACLLTARLLHAKVCICVLTVTHFLLEEKNAWHAAVGMLTEDLTLQDGARLDDGHSLVQTPLNARTHTPADAPSAGSFQLGDLLRRLDLVTKLS